jgi:hypothetical protein
LMGPARRRFRADLQVVDVASTIPVTNEIVPAKSRHGLAMARTQ